MFVCLKQQLSSMSGTVVEYEWHVEAVQASC